MDRRPGVASEGDSPDIRSVKLTRAAGALDWKRDAPSSVALPMLLRSPRAPVQACGRRRAVSRFLQPHFPRLGAGWSSRYRGERGALGVVRDESAVVTNVYALYGREETNNLTCGRLLFWAAASLPRTSRGEAL